MWKSIFSDTIYLVGARVAGLLLAVVGTILIARTLGPEGRGITIYLITLATLGMEVSRFGHDIVCRKVAATDTSKLHQSLKDSMTTSLLTGIPIMAVVLFIAFTHEELHVRPGAILLCTLLIPIGAISTSWCSALVGLGKVKIFSFIELAQKLVLPIGIVIIFTVSQISITRVALLTVVGYGISIVWAGYLLKPYLKNIFSNISVNKNLWKGLALWSWLINLGWLFAQKGVVLSLGYAATIEEVGIYSVASSLGEAVWMVPATVGSLILYPYLLKETDTDKQKRMIFLVALGLGGIILAGTGIAYFLSDWFVNLLFGDEFMRAAPIFVVLCLAGVAFAFFTSMQYGLMALGKEKAVAIGTLVTAGLILLLTPVFHSFLPLIGPAWGILIIYSIMAVYLGVILYKTS
jgi:O-antigen/teichoic acid export membrane protein